jgi:CubicO group peptidase (beta-lactamase class C family)
MSCRPPNFDVSCWKDARWSRWAFRHTADILPVARLAASAGPRRLEKGDAWHVDGWEPFLQTTHATSALIVADGRLVAAWPFTAADDPEPHMLFSVTKSVVGLVARLLIEERAVVPDREAAFYLPDLRGTAFGSATLSELLAMRDGVLFDETYTDPSADIHRYSMCYWGPAPGGARAALAALPGRPRENGFAYRTPVADVVGAVLTTATGRRLADLVGDLLWRPMDAGHAAHFILDTAGVEIAGAGLNAATSDLARLALLLLDGGACNGRQVIPERVVAALFAGGDRAVFAAGYPDRPGWSYHDLWWHMGEGVVAALGVHGQRVIIDSRRRLALVRTGAQPAPDNRPYDNAHHAFLRALAEYGDGSPKLWRHLA